MTFRVTIGIDPGITGAIAVLADGEYFDTWDMPTRGRGKAGKRAVDAGKLAATLRGVMPLFRGATFSAVLEDVHAMPKQGSTSMFSFGRSVGAVDGVLAGIGIRMIEVTPQRWKRHHGLIGADKGAGRVLAASRYPAAPLQLKRHHGRADALLMALWAWSEEL